MVYTATMKVQKPNDAPVSAVVVIGWNNLKLLDECFASVLAQTYANVVLVYVDNASSDGSLEYVRKRYPAALTVDAGSNTGFAVGNNIGFAKALENPDCQYVVALNTDAVLEPGWVKTMVEFADSHPHSACLQGLTLNYYKRDLVDSVGIYIDMRASCLQMGYNEPYDGRGAREVFGVNAAAAMYTRMFLDGQPFGADYFDHDLFMYYEDVDISARALTMGMKNYFCNEAVAYHMGSASSGGNPKFMLTMVHRNLPLVMLKNVPAGVILRTLPGWAGMEIARVVTFLRERRYGLVKAMVLGRLRGLKLIPRFLAKRRKLFAQSHISTAEYRRLMG
jgi:GT2 family glycosyltransferase